MIKLSRSRIELFTECPRCFWLEMKKKIKRPPPAPYTINSAIDYLLKQEFDFYREKGKPHPIMIEHKIDALPYQSKNLSQWRNNFVGIQYHHQPTDFLITGAIDDVWINPAGELIVVDYKATGAHQHQVYDSYQRQLEIYQWLLKQNGYQVSLLGHLVFARVDKSSGFENGRLKFDMFIEKIKGDDQWLEATLVRARKTYDSDEPPPHNEECSYCFYRQSTG